METQAATPGPPPIALRDIRVKTAAAGGTPDRVPFIPTTNNFNALHYGLSIEAVMRDNRVLIPAFLQYLKDYDPDYAYLPGFFPIDAMETAGYTNARWPGPYYGLPEDTPYQFVDASYLQEEDYEPFLRDPSAFLIQKVLTKKYKNFPGLAFLSAPCLAGQSILSLAPLGLPPVRETLMNMIKAGEQVQDALGKMTELAMAAVKAGYPVFGASVVLNPFDDFADNVRGLIDTCMDIVNDPALVLEAAMRWGDATIPSAVMLAKMAHQEMVFVPLHCGMENFMSIENYQKVYWPPLKRLLNALIEAGLTPFVFCEGKYSNRLETIADVPAGKVIYAFEDVDFKRAKAILGGRACIAGGMPTQMLMEGGRPETVRDQVRRMLDICAPGGGYIMSNSLALDHCERALMEAWHEAVLEYGQY
ncbi:MAG: uroporphyrinogen decarboxylase family protein [Clostridia bacterium]|nr:uroporphyrinogen decarboxylase family protein [Clostridia bacterium]